MLPVQPPGAVEGPARPTGGCRAQGPARRAGRAGGGRARPAASAGQSGRAALTAQAQPSGQLQSANGEYVVAYADGATTAAARAAVKAAGGTILKENARVGVATVRSSNPAFV